MSGTTKERLVEAAFALFDERGFEATTVDHIAERAGVGRTTFFRHFPTKEDVIFPDHDAILELVRGRLRVSNSAHIAVAVTEAARLVLEHYLAEGELARSRYRLTSTVAALRAREIAGQGRYARLFREHIHRWLGGADDTALRAELMASAVTTAHNHVLRRWLRSETATPERDLEVAMASALALYEPDLPSGSGPPAANHIVVVRTDRSIEEVVAALGPLSTLA